MLGKVFTAYDIEAAYPKPLNEKLAWQIGYATARFLIARAEEAGHDDPMMRNLVIGRDCRESSPALFEAMQAGANDFGAHTIELGPIDSPMIPFAINYLGCCGGVHTTGSRHPASHNGFKIFGLEGRPVGLGSGLDEIRRLAAMTEREKATPAGGRSEPRDFWEPYGEHVRQFLSEAVLDGSGKKVRIVVDASNGMAGASVPKLFGDVPGLEVIPRLFDSSSGEFEHLPDPGDPEAVAALGEAVRSAGADAGMIFDSDADRCRLVDEQGVPLGGDQLTAWLASYLLEQEGGGRIVYDLRSTRAVREMVEAAGGRAIRCGVGPVAMHSEMRRQAALFGGERSGRFYYRDNFAVHSGIVTLAVVAGALAAGGGTPLSVHLAPARRYAQSGEISFEAEDRHAAIVALERAYPAAEVDELDGVTLDLGDWWCNVRTGGTQPLLRLNLEAPDDATVDEKVAEVAVHLGRRVH